MAAAFILPWWMWAIGGVGAVALVSKTAKAHSGTSSGTGGTGPAIYPLPASKGVPFAAGGARPAWPIHFSSKEARRFEVPYVDVDGKWHGNASRAFKASRGDRWHAGVDIYADGEDIVVAPEDGEVVGRQYFYEGTGAIMLALDSGVNVLLGEVKIGGALEFGLDVGKRVTRGQPVTRVWWHDIDPQKPGIQGGAHMLHLEMYERGQDDNEQWPKGQPPPPKLLDPTDYMLRAKAALTVA